MELVNASGLSKSELANRLDISLPQLSHISSERNKPGLELIQKLLIEFPSVEPNWLINGIGTKYKKPDASLEVMDFLHYAEQKIRFLQLELKEMELRLIETKQSVRL